MIPNQFIAPTFRSLRVGEFVFAIVASLMLGCGSSERGQEAPRSLTPAYNQQTGRLERLTSDRNGDGKIDTWAYMDGARLERVEIDRNGDGIADRFEYYETPAAEGSSAGSALERAAIASATETNGSDKTVVRGEFYEKGVLERVEEDTDGDGRVNKWERHAGGRLVQMDLDLQGKGFPDRRLIYGRGGVERVEGDPDGDGVFVPAPTGKAGQ